ncbi:MAG TPA: efflux RND transporter permease subunit, partial [Fimbriimonas sp.]
MGLTKAAIARPIFIFMLMAAAFLMGTLAYRGMRLELNPDVNFPVVTVTTVYPGAGPEEINNLVSRKIEEAISGVTGIRELTSTSFEGVSSVVAQFEIGTDVNIALNDVRTKVDGVTNALPEDALKPTVGKFDASSQAVLVMSLNSRTLTSQQLRDLIDEKIVDRFAQIPGVASANLQGGDVREIQVQFKRDKLVSYGLGIADVQRQIAASSINMPGGRVVNGDQEYTVRVPAQFETLDDVRNMVLTVSNPQNPMGKAQKVRLVDVADVTDTVEERTSYSRLNGSDTIVISVNKARDGNAVEIAKAADNLIEEIKKEYAAEGITVVKTFEQAEQIKDALKDLNFDLTFAVILVASIVFLFLHDLRGTIIVAIAIPTSIFATFISLNLFGFTINNMTMLALTLAVGVLVD